MVFQNPDNQFVGATAEDDVAFGLENQGVPLEEMRVRVQEALELVGMAILRREPARLSGGQKQRCNSRYQWLCVPILLFWMKQRLC